MEFEVFKLLVVVLMLTTDTLSVSSLPCQAAPCNICAYTVNKETDKGNVFTSKQTL